ncbi:MAG: hypothetical protein AAF532_02190 [Planctomycetota bacterium]
MTDITLALQAFLKAVPLSIDGVPVTVFVDEANQKTRVDHVLVVDAEDLFEGTLDQPGEPVLEQLVTTRIDLECKTAGPVAASRIADACMAVVHDFRGAMGDRFVEAADVNRAYRATETPRGGNAHGQVVRVVEITIQHRAVEAIS